MNREQIKKELESLVLEAKTGTECSIRINFLAFRICSDHKSKIEELREKIVSEINKLPQEFTDTLEDHCNCLTGIHVALSPGLEPVCNLCYKPKPKLTLK